MREEKNVLKKIIITFPAQENGKSRVHNRGEKSQLNHDNYFRYHAREQHECLLIRISMSTVAG